MNEITKRKIMSSYNSHSFSPSKQPYKKRLPQVPHLITHSNKPKPLPLGGHKFVVNTSQHNLLQVTPTHIGENKPLPDIGSNENSVSNSQLSLQQPNNFDKALDEFLVELKNKPLNVSIESVIKTFYLASSCVVWLSVPNVQMLYAQSNGAITSQTQGLAGHCFSQRSLVKISRSGSHPAFSSTIDSMFCNANSCVLLFPLYDHNGKLWSIVEVVRDSEFDQNDESFAKWFSNKFTLLSQWIKTDCSIPLDEFATDILTLLPSNEYLKLIKTKISELFDCTSTEIWKMSKTNGKEDPKQNITRYTDKVETVEFSKSGIVYDAIAKDETVNCTNVQIHQSYNPTIDGRNPQPALAVPILDTVNNLIYAVVLRGPRHNKLFTKGDEYNLRRAGPLILLGLTNCESFSQFDESLKDSKSEREGLTALLEVVEIISSQLNVDNLVELIMEKGRELTNADRCSLFLVNDSRDRLKTSLQSGLDKSIELPIDKGIAGKTATEGKIFNIVDAYNSEFFDSTIDMSSGYRTKSILSVPIYNTRSEIIGVTEMVNKSGGQNFTSWDEKLIQIFNVYCGISLENSKLFNQANQTNNKLRSFFDTAFSMAKSESLQKIFENIMQNAKQSINADRGTIFLYNENEKEGLTTFLADGENIPNSMPIEKGVYGQVVRTKEAVFVNDAYNYEHFNPEIDKITGYKTKSLLVSPILSTNGELIGIVEMLNKKEGEFEKKDLQIINAFATFCSIALERNRYKDIALYGDANIEMKKYIHEDERDKQTVPNSLKLTDDEIQQVSRLNCFAVNFKGIGHFKELFYFFNYFHLREEYQISNEVFFRFIFTISGTYNDVPYHNWTHACDVSQYIFYEVTTSKFDQILTKLELYGLFISAICHDANHQGFNNVFNVKAETPLGILFKDQSVMEMHHIETSIPIIARDDINLFHALNPEETRKIWNLFIKMILSTDMAHHFELVKKAQGLLDEDTFSWEEPECRMLALQLILKVADISNVSRPFELADKWCDILNNEFFRQGDLEKESGIGLTSPLNDRENSDKPKSQIGFYNFICLPLYQVVARIFPELQVNVDSLKSNLEQWKKLAAANAPPPEEKK